MNCIHTVQPVCSQKALSAQEISTVPHEVATHFMGHPRLCMPRRREELEDEDKSIA